MIVIMIMPLLIGLSWQLSWKLEISEDKMIFDATIWHNNYDDLYEFISKKVKIKTFIEKSIENNLYIAIR